MTKFNPGDKAIVEYPKYIQYRSFIDGTKVTIVGPVGFGYVVTPEGSTRNRFVDASILKPAPKRGRPKKKQDDETTENEEA